MSIKSSQATNPMKPDIADFIRNRIREIRGMSFRKLEILSGVSRSEISYIINKKRKRPSPEILQAVAPHLKIRYEYLLFLSGYLSRESWLLVEKGKTGKTRAKGEKVSAAEDSFYPASLLSDEERDLLNRFRSLKDERAKSFLAYFVQLASKSA